MGAGFGSIAFPHLDRGSLYAEAPRQFLDGHFRRFAGAAEQLTDALLVNPHDGGDVARAIWTAMHMPLAERKARWEKLYAIVRDADVIGWADDFLSALTQEPALPEA